MEKPSKTFLLLGTIRSADSLQTEAEGIKSLLAPALLRTERSACSGAVDCPVIDGHGRFLDGFADGGMRVDGASEIFGAAAIGHVGND